MLHCIDRTIVYVNANDRRPFSSVCVRTSHLDVASGNSASQAELAIVVIDCPSPDAGLLRNINSHVFRSSAQNLEHTVVAICGLLHLLQAYIFRSSPSR